MEDDFKGLKAWWPSIKRGILAILLFCVACFTYGWFNDFTFWHAQADAGLNAALGYTIFYGVVFVGPVVFALVTFLHKFLIKK